MYSKRVALVLISCAGVSLAACGDGEPSDAENKASAYRTCEDYVESQLKSPSSADFSGVLGSTMSATSDGYRVAGTVDAQNGFGAQIRSNWTCELSGQADDWDLVDLNIS